MNRTMNPKNLKKVNELKNDRLHGANWLSSQAINVMGLAMRESRAITAAELVNELNEIAAAITEARPSMTSIANYISQLLHQITLISQEQKQMDDVKNSAQAKVKEFIKLVQEAPRKAAENAATMIADEDTLITCSYSSTVCKTFTISRERAKKIEVIIAESRCNDITYGEISAQQLKRHRIPTTVIPDKDINRYIEKTKKALVGADTILIDGSLINGTPTYKLAQAAATAKIPFYSVCETAKFDALNQHRKQPKLEPGFDLIPANLITGIITESGILKPRNVINFQGC